VDWSLSLFSDILFLLFLSPVAKKMSRGAGLKKLMPGIKKFNAGHYQKKC